MRTHSGLWGLFGAAAFAAACAGSTPGAQPHDMSVARHEHAAQQAEAEAAKHAGQFDPQASVEKTSCKNVQRDPSVPCWTTESNPTKEHLAQAGRMRKAATDHRAASQALRDAEASACTGLADEDRDVSPLLRHGDVVGAAELTVPTNLYKGGPSQPRLAGAAVTMRAVPGLTKEYLQRLVSCHVARNSSMGHAMPEMAICPLAVKGAAATVESASGAFRVEVTSSDDGAAAEILKRAKALAASAQ